MKGAHLYRLYRQVPSSLHEPLQQSESDRHGAPDAPASQAPPELPLPLPPLLLPDTHMLRPVSQVLLQQSEFLLHPRPTLAQPPPDPLEPPELLKRLPEPLPPPLPPEDPKVHVFEVSR